jgi:hypothetical protein
MKKIRQWLPMPVQRDGGMLPLDEWHEYRVRRRKHLSLNPQYDTTWWRRPPETVASQVWALLATHGLTFAEFAPTIATRLSPDERRELEATLQQAMTIAVEAFVTAGRDGYLLTVNRLFDGLASGWSDHYRAVKQAGLAARARDMKPDTIKAARRDFLRNGIDALAIWQTLTREWPDNPLFWTKSISYPSALGSARAVKVIFREGPALELLKAILATAKYEQTRHGWTLLPAADAAPAPESESASCYERPYNIVTSGEAALKATAIQERARLIFDTEAFLADYSKAEADSDLRAQYCGVRDELLRRGLSGDIVVRSRFARLINRRFSSVDVWPMHVPAKEGPWEETFPAEPTVRVPGSRRRRVGHPALGEVSSPRGRWFRFQHAIMQQDAITQEDDPVEFSENLRGVDVSASQTAILAILLGLEQLEAITSERSFNAFLAARAWEQQADVLEPGYDGPDDPHLVLLVKQLWMRVLYGAPPAWTVLEQWKKATKVGPGWRKRKREGRTITRAAVDFLHSIPQYEEISKFLKACRLIAKRVDVYRGFEFTDPFDGELVRWNPVERADTVVSSHGLKILVGAPGRMVSRKEREDWEPPSAGRTRQRFVPNRPDPETGDFPIDRKELGQMLAPCFVHALDAALAGHVILALDAAGAQDLISINDAWFAQLPTEDFNAALGRATEAWFRALEPAYDALERSLPPGPFLEMIVRARHTWTARVAAGQWPRFHLKPDVPISRLTEAK